MSFVEKEKEKEKEKEMEKEREKERENNRKPIIKKRDIKRKPDVPDEIPSDLGKRNLVDSFSVQIYNDKERYGQDIPADFFKTNIGHNVYEEKSDLNEAEILDWCYKYLASKNIQI